VIWAIFIADFALRLAVAPGKRRFLIRNWFMAIALIVPALRLLPFLAALGSLAPAGGGQVLLLLGTINRTMNALRASLGRRQVAFVLTLTVAVMLAGAAGMLRLEPHATTSGASGFTGYGDALWWTAMLMTMIGSAYWPQTTAGRILAFLISIYSVGVFGYVTAVFASFFVGEDAMDKHGPVAGADDIAALRDEIRALRREITGRGAAAGIPEATGEGGAAPSR
jgi:voltage-gated potassium channel